jgi:hypothetical protein
MGSESDAGWSRLDWDAAEVRPMVAGGFVLTVRGTAIPMERVELHSLPIGIAPEDSTYKLGETSAERVRVYEKIRSSIWTHNGLFELVDGWLESDSRRVVSKFRLELLDEQPTEPLASPAKELEHARLIPTRVKLEVWRRDRGRCVECGSTDNLHFDHIVPYSKGGSSLVAENVQLLCARHNLAKAAHIR